MIPLKKEMRGGHRAKFKEYKQETLHLTNCKEEVFVLVEVERAIFTCKHLSGAHRPQEGLRKERRIIRVGKKLKVKIFTTIRHEHPSASGCSLMLVYLSGTRW